MLLWFQPDATDYMAHDDAHKLRFVTDYKVAGELGFFPLHDRLLRVRRGCRSNGQTQSDDVCHI